MLVGRRHLGARGPRHRACPPSACGGPLLRDRHAGHRGDRPHPDAQLGVRGRGRPGCGSRSIATPRGTRSSSTTTSCRTTTSGSASSPPPASWSSGWSARRRGCTSAPSATRPDAARSLGVDVTRYIAGGDHDLGRVHRGGRRAVRPEYVARDRPGDGVPVAALDPGGAHDHARRHRDPVGVRSSGPACCSRSRKPPGGVAGGGPAAPRRT